MSTTTGRAQVLTPGMRNAAVRMAQQTDPPCSPPIPEAPFLADILHPADYFILRPWLEESLVEYRLAGMRSDRNDDGVRGQFSQEVPDEKV